MRQKLDEGLDDIRNLLNFRVSINYSVMVVTNTEQCRGGRLASHRVEWGITPNVTAYHIGGGGCVKSGINVKYFVKDHV